MKSEQLRELAEHYDNSDLSDHIEQTTWEEPQAVGEPMVTYALRLPKPVIDRLRNAAEDRGIKVSTLMREWLAERLTIETAGQDADRAGQRTTSARRRTWHWSGTTRLLIAPTGRGSPRTTSACPHPQRRPGGGSAGGTRASQQRNRCGRV